MKSQVQFDDYFMTSLAFAKEVLGEYERISAIELDLVEGVDMPSYQHDLASKLGKSFLVKNRGQQDPTLYKILNSANWATCLILTFVLIIAILTSLGSLTMLVIERRKNVMFL